MREMKSRWAVEIEGDETTISRLENYLASSLMSSNDTFIGRLRDLPVLRSQLWDAMNEPVIVSQLADAELALLQGLTKLGGGASPLRIGTIFEMAPDDAILRQTRVTATAVHVVGDAESPALFRMRLDASRRYDAVAGAVLELSGNADWIKIYKAVEYLEHHFGGEKHLAAKFPARKAALKRIKRTSQSVRHRARAFTQISRPYRLADAERFLQSLIRDVIDLISSPDGVNADGKFVITKRDYPPEQVIGLKPLILVNGKRSDAAVPGDTLTISEDRQGSLSHPRPGGGDRTVSFASRAPHQEHFSRGRI